MKTNRKTKFAATTVDEIKAATAQLVALRRTMTFAAELSGTERAEHNRLRLGPQKLRILENRLQAAQQNRGLLPEAFDLRKFEREVAMTSALNDCLAAIDDVRNAVKDTFLTVGNRAMVSGKATFDHIRVATTTAQKLEKTVEKLSLRAPRSGDKKAAAESIPQPVKPVDTGQGTPASPPQAASNPGAVPGPAAPMPAGEPKPKAA